MSCCARRTKQNELDKILDLFRVPPETMLDVSQKFDAAMTRGVEGLEDHDVRMFPTYITAVPNSKEKGRFLSLDLGFSRLVISLVELRGKCVYFRKSTVGVPKNDESSPGSLPSNMRWTSKNISSKKSPIAYESLEIDLPDGIKTAKGGDFFQYLVDRLKDFLAISSRVPSGTISLGFNFPCPCRRTGPGNGILTNWTKDYECEGVLGNDVAVMLQDALDRNQLSHIRVEVLLNDTLATLLAGSYGPSTMSVLVGVMLGTATNAVFQERLDQIPTTEFHAETMECYKTYEDKTMIIDTEWGAFGESSGDLDDLRTEFDQTVDENSKNPGRDILTKMMCGMYTGEIVRLILAKLHELGQFVVNQDSPLWSKEGRWKLTHMHMASVETDRGITFSSTKKVLAEFGLRDLDHESCRIVKKVCEAVTVRSACLAGAGLAAIIRRIPKELVTIAIDGSLVRFHPTYKRRLEESIDTVLKMQPSTVLRRRTFALKYITDGAIIGAGIAAACFARDKSGNKYSYAKTRTASRVPSTASRVPSRDLSLDAESVAVPRNRLITAARVD